MLLFRYRAIEHREIADNCSTADMDIERRIILQRESKNCATNRSRKESGKDILSTID